MALLIGKAVCTKSGDGCQFCKKLAVTIIVVISGNYALDLHQNLKTKD
jgi:hypothetical protein